MELFLEIWNCVRDNYLHKEEELHNKNLDSFQDAKKLKSVSTMTGMPLGITASINIRETTKENMIIGWLDRGKKGQ